MYSNGYICVTYHVIITRHFVSAYKNRFVAQLLRIQTLPNIQVITMSTDVKSNNSIIIEKCDKGMYKVKGIEKNQEDQAR